MATSRNSARLPSSVAALACHSFTSSYTRVRAAGSLLPASKKDSAIPLERVSTSAEGVDHQKLKRTLADGTTRGFIGHTEGSGGELLDDLIDLGSS